MKPKNNLLLKIADIFCQRAQHSFNLIKNAQSTYSAGGDDEEESLSFDMIDLARDVDDVQMRSDLLEIAALYDKVLSMGVGYHTVNELISSFFSKHLDGLSSYYERKYTPLTNLLNEVSTDLETRAGAAIDRPDTPQTIETLKTTKEQLAKETLEEYNKRSQEQAELPQSDEDIPIDSGTDEEDPDLSDYQGDVVFDPTAGMGKEQAGKGSGRGISTGRIYENINWKEVYDKEKERYRKIYENNTNLIVRKKIDELLKVISELENRITLRDNIRKAFSQTPHAQKVKELNKIKNGLMEQLSNNPAPQLEKEIKNFQNKIKEEIKNAPATPQQQDLNSFNEKQKELNLLRNNIKLEINRLMAKQNNIELELERNKAGTSDINQKILDLEIRRNDLTFGRNRNIAKEKTLIDMLIRNLKSNSSITQGAYDKIITQIDAARDARTSIKTEEEFIQKYLSELNDELKSGKITIKQYNERKENIEANSKKPYDRQRYIHRQEEAQKTREKKESGSLTGLIIHLQQKLATQKNEAAKAIKKKASQDPYFDSYKKSVQIAKDRLNIEYSPNNQIALDTAIRVEVEALKNYLENHPTILKIKTDLAQIYIFRDAVKNIDETNFGVDPNSINQLIILGEQLINVYGKLYKSPSSSIKDIIDFLKSTLG